MNILITGANGLLGRYLAEFLSKGNKIFALIKNKKDIRFKLNKNINIIEMNLSRIDESLFPQNLDAVYYLAQSNRFREFPDGADDVLDINVVAPNKIAKWAIKNNIQKFIYASSGGVYTNLDSLVKESLDINANKKLGFYLNSKLSAEMLLKNYANLFETFAIIRPFFMYGAGQNESMLIPRLINNVKNGKEIMLNGDEGIKINPVYITDAVNSTVKILDLKGEFLFNIAGNEIFSLKQICLIIGEILHKEPIFKINENMQNDLIADISIMKKKLCSPLMSFKKGVARVIGGKDAI